MTLWLSDSEIDDMCDGLINNAAKVRYLRTLGLTVTQKPNGRPLVMRIHAEAVLSGLQQTQHVVILAEKHGPNRAGLAALFGKPAPVA